MEIEIDYKNSKTTNITKQWTGSTSDGIEFIIDGGWNDWDGYYVDSIEILDFEGDEDELVKEIEEKFLKEINE